MSCLGSVSGFERRGRWGRRWVARVLWILVEMNSSERKLVQQELTGRLAVHLRVGRAVIVHSARM